MSASLPRLLSEKELCALIGVSRVTLWQWRRDGKFPQPVRVGPNTNRWPEPVIAKFLEQRTPKAR
jgi:prophage regulatory protein